MVASLAVGAIHIMNHCISAAAVIQNLLRKENGHFFKWRFGNVFYTKSGSGSPLLLIHDLSPFSSSFEWNEIVKTLSKSHTVYCLDLSGCGRSDKPEITYTNYFFVQLVNDFIRKVIGEKTDIAATGLSSSFVIMAAREHPELFSKITMVNPPSIARLRSTPVKYASFIKLFMDLPIIGTAVYHIYASKENMEYQFTENYFYNPFLVKRKVLHTYYESAHLQNSKGKYLLSSLRGCYVNSDITHALKESKHPIFLIEGSKMENGKDIAEQYRKINDAIQVSYISDTKLYPQLENPSEFLQKII